MILSWSDGERIFYAKIGQLWFASIFMYILITDSD